MIHVEALTRKFGDVTAVDNVSFTLIALVFSAPLDASVLICLAVAFILLGAWRFSKIEV